MTRIRAWGVWGVLCGACAVGAAQPDGWSSRSASFFALHDLPGGTFSSSARALSGDGTVVVGLSKTTQGDEAFRWTQETGMVSLGDLPGGTVRGIARGVSNNGSVVVGQGNTADGIRAFRWTAATGMVDLGSMGGGDVVARACSADGSVVVGTETFAGSKVAFRWTAASGLTPLPMLSEGFLSSDAASVSADGSVIVGSVIASSGESYAVRWTVPASGPGAMELLGDIPGGADDSWATSVSADGTRTVGAGSSAASDSGYEAFLYSAGVFVPLGDLPDGSFQSYATGVSADGSIVVGYSDDTPSPFFKNYTAFVWISGAGMRPLADMLTQDYGLDLTGWKLVIPFAISPDGRNIAGVGVNPSGQTEAWAVRLGGGCTADFDGDGFVTGDDFDLFVNYFIPGDPRADFDHDGFVSGDDFDSFVAAFEAGC